MTVREFTVRCDGYFDSLRDESGEIKRPPTISGLCLALEMEKSAFFSLLSGGKLSAPARKALLTIECWLEEEMVKNRGQQGLAYALGRLQPGDRPQKSFEDYLLSIPGGREF